MQEILELTLSAVFTSGAAFWIVWFDERRLTPEQEYFAWPETTRLAAVVAFGPLCLPVHFWRTRRSLLGFLFGLVCTAALIAFGAGVSYLIEQLA